MRDELHTLDYGNLRDASPPRRSPPGLLPLAAFIFGNVWLLAALAMFLGRKFARSEPYMVSFTSEGAWLYPGTYSAVNILCIVVAAGCFWLIAATRRAA